MSTKLKIGIFFGGQSREREISFRGGKTAYTHLDKNLFEPVLLFVDSLGHFIEVDTEIFDKESIREVYPSKNLNKGFRLYIESLGELNDTQLYKLIYKIGKQVKPEKLHETIDIAFPVMHGPYAEDGSIQGLFEWYGIPYVGPNLLASAIGIHKPFQNALLQKSVGLEKKSRVVSKKEWDTADRSSLFSSLTKEIGFPLVVKAPHQGSSIGVGIVQKRSLEDFSRKMSQCFFEQLILAKDWKKLSKRQKKNQIDKILDLSEGIGFPLVLNGEIIYHPKNLLSKLKKHFETNEMATLTSSQAEDFVLIEEFIEGQEFSMGLIQDENLKVYALPPTEIYGELETFDFKSKYQSNATKKRIPIDTSVQNLQKIEEMGIQAFSDLGMNVICRIDGFLKASHEVVFHDPNTIPGMSPSSFIFKQMAEVGLNITQSINYFVRQSIVQRIHEGKNHFRLSQLLDRLNSSFEKARYVDKKTVAVVFGENETEYALAQSQYNALSATGEYEATCICAAKNGNFYIIPINLMYKADIQDFGRAISAGIHPFVKTLIAKTAEIREFYAGELSFEVKRIEKSHINKQFDYLYLASSQEMKATH